jgi:excisionase family DNA binding protein
MDITKTTHYSIREAAAILKVHYCTAYGWAMNGEIETIQIGKRRRITAEALNKFCHVDEPVAEPAAPQPPVRDTLTMIKEIIQQTKLKNKNARAKRGRA